MIYLGLIHWDNVSEQIGNLLSAVEGYTRAPPTVVKRNALTLVFGQISAIPDVDDIWENATSLMMGRVFDNAQKKSVSKKEFLSFSSLNKEEVLSKVWGKYIYIQSNISASQFDIVIDPTGQLPFFYSILPDGNILFSSDIALLFDFLKKTPEYNWTYLSSYLVYGNSSAIQTPFQNVFELPPACCIKMTRTEKKTESFWNPLRTYEKKEWIEKGAKNVLQDTLKPWIAPYQNICVSLSGGLDSSALVYCLKEIVSKKQTLSAFNYFHSSIQSSNELVHARQVCKETGIELLELDSSEHLPFSVPVKKPIFKPNKPFPGLVNLNWIDILSNYIAKDSCTVMSGHGSDHIFMRPPSKRSIADYILEKGLKGSKNQFSHIAHFYRDSFFPILKETVKSMGSYVFSYRLHKRHRKNIQDELSNWMKKTLLRRVSSDFLHPIYLTLPSQLLPGKYDQIDQLYEGLASIHMEMDRLNPMTYPFLYQPVMEFALAFPSYKLFHQGYDRFPLRHSISEHFKTQTVWRRDKSQTTGIMQLGVKKNLNSILDLCLHGQCVKGGLVEKERLHQNILSISNGDTRNMWPFIHLVTIEIWLKAWQNGL